MLAITDFNHLPAALLAEAPDIVPRREGVYGLLLPRRRLGDGDLHDVFSDPSQSTVFPDHLPLYLGCSGENIGGRLKSHVLGESYASTFRMAVGVLLHERLGLVVQPMEGRNYFRFAEEEPLTEWILCNIEVAYVTCTGAWYLEEALIRSEAPLLNVTGRTRTEFTTRMQALRAKHYTKERG